MKDFEFLNILSRLIIYMYMYMYYQMWLMLKNDFEKRRLVLIVYK